MNKKMKNNELDINGEQMNEGVYIVTESGTSCQFNTHVTVYNGKLSMEIGYGSLGGGKPIFVPIKECRKELDFTREAI